MHEDIKKYADEGNSRELKYRFNNSLDIDPTFEKYRDDFEYCKDKNAFEKHKKLTPLEYNKKSNWNDIYWANLKKDLFENFSQKRLEHMIEVAKVIYKDKIERLIEERQQPKEEPKYTKITSEPTEEEKTIEKQKNKKKRTEQIVSEENELEKTNEVIETAIIQKQEELDKGQKETKIISSNIKKENEKSFIKDGLMIVGSSLLLGVVAGKMILDNINSREKKSVKDRVQAILHSKISPNEKIAKLENIKTELSNRLNSSNNKRKIEEHIEQIDNYISSLQQAETFIDENTIEE